MLKPHGPEIWFSDGPPIVAAAGFHYPTRMVVVRLRDGDLWVWSPVALREMVQDDLSKLGPVAHLVAPNTLHDSYLSDWAQAFPDAAIHGAPGLAEARGDLVFASTLSETPHLGWEGEIAQVVIRTKLATEVVFFHRKSGTVIFTDLLQQMPRGWYRGWRAVVARLDLMTAHEPSVPRKFRLALIDKAQARAALRQVLAWPVQTVVMAHGTPVEYDAKAFLARAFKWLRF